MKKVCIVVGHSAEDGGAYNEFFKLNEYDFNIGIAAMIAAEVHRRGVLPIIMFRDGYLDMIAALNETEAELAIELHCNAAENREAKGCTMLHWHSSVKGKALAQDLQDAIHPIFNEQDRGLKPIRSGENGAPFLQKTKMPSVILEPFFLSNNKSVGKAISVRRKMAKAVAMQIAKHLGGDISPNSLIESRIRAEEPTAVEPNLIG